MRSVEAESKSRQLPQETNRQTCFGYIRKMSDIIVEGDGVEVCIAGAVGSQVNIARVSTATTALEESGERSHVIGPSPRALFLPHPANRSKRNRQIFAD